MSITKVPYEKVSSRKAQVPPGQERWVQLHRQQVPAEVTASLLELGGASSAPYWSGKNHDVLRTGFTEAVAKKDLSGGPTWSWQPPSDIGIGNTSMVRAAPVIDAEKNIYLSTISGLVVKFSPTGQILWMYTGAKSQIPSVPALANGVLYVGAFNGDVIALDARTGSELWRNVPTDMTCYWDPSFGGNLCSGLETWSMGAAEGVVVSVRIDAQFFTWAGGNNHILGINATTGKTLWDFIVPEKTYNILAPIVDSSVIFADERGTLHRLNLFTGEVIYKNKLWPQAGWSTGGAIVSSDKKKVFVTHNVLFPGVEGYLVGDWERMGLTLTMYQEGHISAFSLEDGSLLWDTVLPLPADSGPATGLIAPGGKGPAAVVMGMGPNPASPSDPSTSNSPKPSGVAAVDAETGKVKWIFNLPMWYGATPGDSPTFICMPDSFSNPSISGDGVAYIGTMTGRIYALQDVDGDGQLDESKGEVSYWNASFGFQGSPGIAPGLLAVTPCNGLHVFLS